MFAGSTVGIIGGVAFAALLAVACASDLRTRRIPNWLVLVMAAGGIVFSLAIDPVLPGLGRAFAGIGVGLALWLPFWLLRMLGAGDVKLFAAAAAWLGVGTAVEAALLTALYGGAIAFVHMVRNGGWSLTIVRLAHGLRQPSVLREPQSSRARWRMPYALAIAAGLLTAAWFPGTLLS